MLKGKCHDFRATFEPVVFRKVSDYDPTYKTTWKESDWQGIYFSAQQWSQTYCQHSKSTVDSRILSAMNSLPQSLDLLAFQQSRKSVLEKWLYALRSQISNQINLYWDVWIDEGLIPACICLASVCVCLFLSFLCLNIQSTLSKSEQMCSVMCLCVAGMYRLRPLRKVFDKWSLSASVVFWDAHSHIGIIHKNTLGAQGPPQCALTVSHNA